MSSTENITTPSVENKHLVDRNLQRAFALPEPENLPDEIMQALSQFDALDGVTTNAVSTGQEQHSAHDAPTPSGPSQPDSPFGRLRSLFQRCESALPRTRHHRR